MMLKRYQGPDHRFFFVFVFLGCIINLYLYCKDNGKPLYCFKQRTCMMSLVF